MTAAVDKINNLATYNSLVEYKIPIIVEFNEQIGYSAGTFTIMYNKS